MIVMSPVFSSCACAGTGRAENGQNAERGASAFNGIIVSLLSFVIVSLVRRGHDVGHEALCQRLPRYLDPLRRDREAPVVIDRDEAP